jgi:hypothetical protein
MDTETTSHPINPLGFAETDRRDDYLKTRATLLACPDVFEVRALSWIQQEGRWLWCITTVYATWPKYVVGYLDPASGEAQETFQCGREDSAIAAFDELNFGDHQ